MSSEDSPEPDEQWGTTTLSEDSPTYCAEDPPPVDTKNLRGEVGENRTETWGNATEEIDDGESTESPESTAEQSLYPDAVLTDNQETRELDDVLHTAELYYTDVIRHNLLGNPQFDTEKYAAVFGCAAIVAARRVHDAPIRTAELATALDLKQSLILKKYIELCGELGLETMPVSPRTYLDRFTRQLPLADGATELAYEIYDAVEGTSVENGYQPAAMAAGTIYAANVIGPKTVMQEDLISTSGLSEFSVRGVYKDVLLAFADHHGVEDKETIRNGYAAEIARLFDSTTALATEQAPDQTYPDSEYNFVCPDCDHTESQFRSYADLYRHAILTHPVREVANHRYEKANCAVSQDSPLPNDNPPEPEQCPYCGIRFPTELSLDIHHARAHPEMDSNRLREDYERRMNYVCPDCENSYRTFHALNCHAGHMHPGVELANPDDYAVDEHKAPVTDISTQQVIEQNSPAHLIARMTGDSTLETTDISGVPTWP